jgi:hypothetical protein
MNKSNDTNDSDDSDTNDNDDIDNEDYSNDIMEGIEGRNAVLSKLYGTKLYWFLIRCLEDNGASRQLYYI